MGVRFHTGKVFDYVIPLELANRSQNLGDMRLVGPSSPVV